MKTENPVIKIKEIKHSNKIITVLVWPIQSVKKNNCLLYSADMQKKKITHY